VSVAHFQPTAGCKIWVDKTPILKTHHQSHRHPASIVGAQLKAIPNVSFFKMSPTNGTFDKDPEKADAPEEPPVARGTATEAWDSEPATKDPWQRRFVDSFRRDPNAHVIKPGQSIDPHGGHGFDHKTAAERTANSGLAHKLKSRHMQMVSW